MSAAPTPVVVVPEGLSQTSSGANLSEPSFVFRQVLDHVAQLYRGDFAILIAPANRFGGPQTEQEAARLYLEAKGIADITAPPSPSGRYIDTFGNALLLRRWLFDHGKWPIRPITLVVAKVHAARACLCFQRVGFRVAKLDAVPYEIRKNDPIVRRLFYYRHPSLHRFYEMAATVRDFLRPIPGSLS